MKNPQTVKNAIKFSARKAQSPLKLFYQTLKEAPKAPALLIFKHFSFQPIKQIRSYLFDLHASRAVSFVICKECPLLYAPCHALIRSHVAN